MADERVRAAGRNWAGRFIANGADFVRTVLDPERNRRGTLAAVRPTSAAHRHLDPSAERVEAPLDSAAVVANLRRPGGEGPARERAGAPNLAGVAERVRQPRLVVTGRRDRVIAGEDTKRIADAVPGATWVLDEEGTHVCNNIPSRYRPLVADWMRAQLQ